MSESDLDRFLRLARSHLRHNGSRPVAVRSYEKKGPVAPQARYGTPYRVAWANVHVGNILEFGQEMWRVIPAAAYKGRRAPEKPGKMPPVEAGSATEPGQQVPQAQAHTMYLQNVRNSREHDELTLPAEFLVTVIPVLP